MKQRLQNNKLTKMLKSFLLAKVFTNLSRLAWSYSILVFIMGKKELIRSRAYPYTRKLIQSSTSMINLIWLESTGRIYTHIWIKALSLLFKMYFSCLIKQQIQLQASLKSYQTNMSRLTNMLKRPILKSKLQCLAPG